MYNPKDVLTEHGYEEWRAHLCNMRAAVFTVLNEADDLHIGDEQLDLMYKVQELLESNLLRDGDGESRDG